MSQVVIVQAFKTHLSILRICYFFIYFFVQGYIDCVFEGRFSLVTSSGHTIYYLMAETCFPPVCHLTPPCNTSQHLCPPAPSIICPPHVSIPPLASAVFQVFLSLYVVIFLLAVFHLFCLVLHCVSVSGVTSVVLPYGR